MAAPDSPLPESSTINSQAELGGEIWEHTSYLAKTERKTVALETCVDGFVPAKKRVVKRLSWPPRRPSPLDELRRLRVLSTKVRISQCQSITLKVHHYKNVLFRMSSVFQDDVSICIITEYPPCGNLLTSMRSLAERFLHEYEVVAITRQVLNALEVIHAEKLFHGDVKPSVVKVANFGINNLLYQTDDSDIASRNSSSFKAPELRVLKQRLHDLPYQARQCTDIWALGETVFWMLTGKVCFVDDALLVSFLAGTQDFPDDDLKERSVSTQGINFITSLMEPFSNDRLVALAAKTHKWLVRAPYFGNIPFADYHYEVVREFTLPVTYGYHEVHISFSPTTDLMVIVKGFCLEVLDTLSGRKLYSDQCRAGPLRNVAFYSDGLRFVTVARNRTPSTNVVFEFYEIHNGVVESTEESSHELAFETGAAGRQRLVMAPDDQRLIYICDSELYVMNLTQKSLTHRPVPLTHRLHPPALLHDVAFAYSCTRTLVATETALFEFNIVSGRFQLKQVKNDKSLPMHAAISRHGKFIAMIGEGGLEVHTRSMRWGRPWVKQDLMGATANHISWAPCGKVLVVGATCDGTNQQEISLVGVKTGDKWSPLFREVGSWGFLSQANEYLATVRMANNGLDGKVTIWAREL
ncbi:hypothetical protein G7046_g9564 [Stylonectria norvegica]|nr:hypothetical protein G7046_g9564 [Stylonectria norvegica]